MIITTKAMIMHIENLSGDISHPALQNRRLIIGCFPWKFQGGEANLRRVLAFDRSACLSTLTLNRREILATENPLYGDIFTSHGDDVVPVAPSDGFDVLAFP
ncbi:MAG TPA: hypothetical protein VE871_18590 [Longimicrobium sp.]|nr:hypothetical protein [Longimicrobium sp.]